MKTNHETNSHRTTVSAGVAVRQQDLKVAGKMNTMKAQILSVRIEKVADNDSNSSYLGKYSDSYSDGDYAIVRVGEHSGQFVDQLPEDAEIPSRGREFRFFIPPADNYTGEQDSDIRKYCQQDYQRMEQLNNGDWCYIGIIAKAEICSASGIHQTLRSGGLWGVESDAGDYLQEVAKEELSALRTELESFEFGKRAIDYAFKNVTEVCR